MAAFVGNQSFEQIAVPQQALIDPRAITFDARRAIRHARIIEKRNGRKCMSLHDHYERQELVTEADARKQQCKIQTRCIAAACKHLAGGTDELRPSSGAYFSRP